MTSMTRGLLAAALIGGLLLTATGCPRQEERQAEPTPGQPALAGDITVAGSTAVHPIAQVLAERFSELHPQVRINVQAGGSSAGIRAAREGGADIGMSSRPLKAEEKGLYEVTIAWDGIVPIVHPANPVKDITLVQFREIFVGRLTNWSQLGGPDRAILVVTREEGSGTRGAFEDMVMDDEPITDRAIVQNHNGGIRTTVAGDPNAIGYLSMGALTPEVAVLNVDGVAPSVQAIRDGQFAINRPFLFLTARAPEGVTAAFIEFVLSAEGQAIIAEEGYIPIN
ncbi:MAG TPA: phosphate ABC transporter substrate-binding protein [Bacillota bacterium]|nr:phosphate ABC transporter substrate-binding protein [Bacillota bacterium]